MGRALRDDEDNLRPMVEFLGATLEQIDHVDREIHMLRDNLRSRLSVLNLMEDQSFVRQIIDAERTVLEGELPERDPVDALRHRFDVLAAE